MCCCFDKKSVAKKARTYNVNSRELNNASKRLVPYENIYGYTSTRIGEEGEDCIRQMENTFKKNYLKYMNDDFRLKQTQERITNLIYKVNDGYDDALDSAIRHIDFVFGKCLFDKDLNKNN